MYQTLRRSLHSFVPSHFRDPFGLLVRLLKSRDPAARFALVSAAAGLALTPVDLLLAFVESRRHERAVPPERPIIFVCGPPRSGTTLVEQVLISHLPVAWLNNLTSLFPRAPLTANALFGRFLASVSTPSYESYYGKTAGLNRPNDALYLWDRWAGSDRTRPPEALTEEARTAMWRFFGACEQFYGKPLVTKNNSLDTYAHLVAEVLENAYFICLNREPVYLAQALLRARHDIHGSSATAYGVDDAAGEPSDDVIRDVCRQVTFHNHRIAEQERRIGGKRFWVISYEAFCADPRSFVNRVASEILHCECESSFSVPARFEHTNRVRIGEAEFARIQRTLARSETLYHAS
jgi:hypothetical protein